MVDDETLIKQMNDIINQPELIYVDPGDDEEVVRLIELINKD